MTAATGAVVAGVGNPYRRDDGVGPALVERLAAVAPPGVAVVAVSGDTTRLLDVWDGVRLAVVVDAARSGRAPAGTLHRDVVPARRQPNRLAGTHGLEVADALRLSRALGRSPARLVLLTVEVADLGPGTGLSAAVSRALPRLTDAVLQELGTEG